MSSSNLDMTAFRSASIEDKVDMLAAALSGSSDVTIDIQYKSPSSKRLTIEKKGNWIDLYADANYFIKAGAHVLVDLGVAMKLPEGFEAYIVPRSSTYKKWHIIQANHIGVVDNSYCGPNDWWKMSVLAMEDTEIKKGEKICQFRITRIQPNVVFNEVEQLTGEDRGGFGSTGSV